MIFNIQNDQLDPHGISKSAIDNMNISKTVFRPLDVWSYGGFSRINPAASLPAAASSPQMAIHIPPLPPPSPVPVPLPIVPRPQRIQQVITSLFRRRPRPQPHLPATPVTHEDPTHSHPTTQPASHPTDMAPSVPPTSHFTRFRAQASRLAPCPTHAKTTNLFLFSLFQPPVLGGTTGYILWVCQVDAPKWLVSAPLSD
jgi:hypothetical protein